MPEKWSRDNITFTLHPSSLTFDPNLDCDLIAEAVKRYSHIVSLYKEESSQEESDVTKVELLSLITSPSPRDVSASRMPSSA